MNILFRNEISSIICYMKMEKNLCDMNWFQRTIALLVNNNKSWVFKNKSVRFYSPSGLPGSGAGKGGGGGGSVRDSGGKLGEYGAAQEEHYFFNKQKEQLEKLKKKLKSDKPGDMAQKQDK